MSGGLRRDRLLSASAAMLLFSATAVMISNVRADERPVVAAATAPSSDAGGSAELPPDSPTQDDSTVEAGLPASLLSADNAAAVSARQLLDDARSTATDEWADLSTDRWRNDDVRPVYVGNVTLSENRVGVDADIVVAFEADRDLAELSLRLLPAADALGPDTSLALSVERDGRAAPRVIDGAGALLVVTLDPPVTAGEAVSLRIRMAYDLIDRRAIVDDGGPAAFGLLAWNSDVSVLGHWLPLLTIPGDDGPMIPWGDVGAFPVAIWSMHVTHPGQLVTGASDTPCMQPIEGCTWARGTLLRDLAMVVFDDDAVQASTTTEDTLVRTTSPPASRLALAVETANQESATSLELFTKQFGPLGWLELDVVAAPLSVGAAGMEFPGLVIVDTDVFNAIDGGFGTYVIAHEVAHQWFHALMGNGSLSNPVVDESLAQYASYLYWYDVYGPGPAATFASDNFNGRYQRAQTSGLIDEAPAKGLSEFRDGDAYGPLVYARAPLAWVAAEDVIGHDGVIDFIARLVEDYGLGFVTDEDVLAAARDADDGLAGILDRYWFDPRSLGASS